jgi:N-methylhydantoinase A
LSEPAGTYRVATDVGGTFTDLVGYRVDRKTGSAVEPVVYKVDSTPPDFADGVFAALGGAGLDPAAIGYFAHGSTVVINTLLSRSGAPTALVTTEGFRDVLEIGRGNRPDLFNLYYSKPPPFVPRRLRFEMRERTDHLGEVLVTPDATELDAIADALRIEGIDAVALCFLHAYANSENERYVEAELTRRLPGVSVLASHRVSTEWREFERTSSTVLAAYVHPVTSRYIDALAEGMDARGVPVPPHLMLSNGGVAGPSTVGENPLALIESGPASGVIGAAAVGRAIGRLNVVTLDIGGTTAKCSLIRDGQIRIVTDYAIEQSKTSPGYPARTPVVDIVEIGNGGGSIAWLDEGGKLHVGPVSAGARPGPAIYGRGGTRATTTDAHALTGRIDPSNLLGGRIKANVPAARAALGEIADMLEVDVMDVARGIVRVANANMARVLRLVSVNRGYDPRDFSLVTFGGGGGLHAVELAVALRFSEVVVPREPSTFSAWGMLVSELRRDAHRTRVMPLEGSTEEIHRIFATLESDAAGALSDDGAEASAITFERRLALRYRGQEHTVEIRRPPADGVDATTLEARTAEAFHEAYREAYTYRLDAPIQVVTVHLVARAPVPRPELPELTPRGTTPEDAVTGARSVDFGENGAHEARVYRRELLDPGVTISGPAVIEEDAFATIVPPRYEATVDPFGNLVIPVEGSGP